MKIISIVGARPEFIQAKPVSQAIRRRHREILVHTGQHYDFQMSQAFFEELDLPKPDYNLGVGSASHGRQTAEMLVRIENVLVAERPDLVIVRGDTNSTLAGALAAAKLHIPSAHIEAGERSFDRRMPEEINRLLADRIADLHFCASQTAVRNLAEEGIRERVYWVGDVMLDVMLSYRDIARNRSEILRKLGLKPKQYALVTVHRAGTTDNPQQLGLIIRALNQVPETIVFPVHPRTQKALREIGATFGKHIQAIDPVGYLDMVQLEENARIIATDSGGVQREAYFLQVPCLTLRDRTEWTETVATGWNHLVGVEPERILNAWFNLEVPEKYPAIFGDGTAGERIARILDTSPANFGESL